MRSALDLRASWADGACALGAWSALPCAFAAELMCVPGIDYLCIDQQHGLIDYDQMVQMLRAVEGRGAVPFTRVPANETWLISKALDCGIQGVIVPMVNNREEAEAAVRACRYPPHGIRSYGPVRSALSMGAREVEILGDGVLCFVMVETREGVNRIDEIASTPGLDGIYVGPADLALGLGLPPDLDKTEPEHVAAVDAILKACQNHGIVPGIQCGSGIAGLKMQQKGFRFITVAKDSAIIPQGVGAQIAAAAGREPAATSQGYT